MSPVSSGIIVVVDTTVVIVTGLVVSSIPVVVVPGSGIVDVGGGVPLVSPGGKPVVPPVDPSEVVNRSLSSRHPASNTAATAATIRISRQSISPLHPPARAPTIRPRMRADDWSTWTAWRTADAVRRGHVSAREVTVAALARAAADPHHAWRSLAPGAALAAADAVDAARARGDRPGLLAGVPLGLKDNLVTAGLETTAGSRLLTGWIPPHDGDQAARLRAAGAVILGKLALDEFAMGSSGEHSPFTPAENPRAPGFVPGGSSSGPAAAVAGGTACAAIASDTGGSIRLPAAFCGLVGVKPTWGRVSRRGLIAFASSLDQVGPIARDVRDAALLLTCLAGQDPGDSTSLADPVPDYLAAVADGRARDLGDLRIGVPPLPDLDPAVARSFADSLALLAARGATILDLTLAHAAHAVATYVVISAAEATSNLARHDGVRYGAHVSGEDPVAATRAAGFGREVQRRLLLGSLALRGHHAQAARVRALIARDYDLAFQTCDLIATPVAPIPPFRRGELLEDPLAMAMVDRFTVGPSLAGLPAIAVPAGPAPARPDRPALPIGLQLIAPRLGEPLLFRVAAALEPHA